MCLPYPHLMGFPEDTHWERAKVSSSSGCASVGGQTKLTLHSSFLHFAEMPYRNLLSYRIGLTSAPVSYQRTCQRKCQDSRVCQTFRSIVSLFSLLWITSAVDASIAFHPAWQVMAWTDWRSADSITAADVHNVPYRLMIYHDLDHAPLPTSTIQHMPTCH